MKKRYRVRACMIGDSIFKVGDYTSLAQGWGLYKNQLSIEECAVLQIKDIYYIYEEGNNLPKFKAVVKTNQDRILNVYVSDLKDVRNIRKNREELNKVGYDFKEGAIYCKGYENTNGQWQFFNVGLEKGHISL